ncbi:MAG: nitroreductase family protein [Treponemataceae bacterium]|nr:nitroreductase family protein [Treponemataceae bacterium]
MNTLIDFIKQRRSCRAFTTEAVSENDVQTILECALAAPSGMGKQTWQFTAVTDTAKIQKLAKAVAAALGRDSGYTMYDPAVLIITSNDKESRFREVDNACAMENIYLASEALGLGCVWINQINDCFDNEGVRSVLREFGVPDNHGVYGAAAIGYKAGAEPRAKTIIGKAVIVK